MSSSSSDGGGGGLGGEYPRHSHGCIHSVGNGDRSVGQRYKTKAPRDLPRGVYDPEQGLRDRGDGVGERCEGEEETEVVAEAGVAG
jgi:hypothetical protein